MTASPRAPLTRVGSGLLAVCLAVLTTAAMAGPLDTFHQDHRTAPKLLIDPQWNAIGGATPLGTAAAR